MKKAKKVLTIIGIVIFLISTGLSIAYFITDNYDLRIASEMLDWPFWIVIFIAVFLPQKKNVQKENNNETDHNN